MKIKTLSQTFLIGVCLTWLSACGPKPAEKAAQAVGQTVKTFELQGKTFESEECQTPILMRLFSSKGYKTRIQFAGNHVTLTTVYYGNTQCTGPKMMSFYESGTFDHKDQAGPDGTDQIDIHYDKLEAMVNSPEGQHFAQSEAMGACGHRDWPINQKINVTEQSANVNCYMQRVPREIRDIYRLDGTTLYFGHGYNDRNSSERPSQLNMNEPYRSI